MMRVLVRGDEESDAGLGAGRNVGRAEIIGIGQQILGPAEVGRQGSELVQHGGELLIGQKLLISARPTHGVPTANP